MTKLTNESYLKLHTNESLKTVLVDVMNEYARRFCEMYEFQEGWWVADDPCGTYCTDDIEVSISAAELVFCVDNDIDGDTFSQWWEYVLNTDEPTINLRSWCIGARPEMTKPKRNQGVSGAAFELMLEYLVERGEITLTGNESFDEMLRIQKIVMDEFEKGGEK